MATHSVVSVRLEKKLKDALKNIAISEDLTLTQVIRRALREYLDKRKAATK